MISSGTGHDLGETGVTQVPDVLFQAGVASDLRRDLAGGVGPGQQLERAGAHDGEVDNVASVLALELAEGLQHGAGRDRQLRLR